MGAYPGGLAFFAKDAQRPIPTGKVFHSKLTNPLLSPWVSRGSTPGEANDKCISIRERVYPREDNDVDFHLNVKDLPKEGLQIKVVSCSNAGSIVTTENFLR